MPITKKQFESGVSEQEFDEWITRVQSHLAESKDKAYTLEELHGIFDVEKGSDQSGLLHLALQRLKESGKVGSAYINGQMFYSVG